MVISCNTARLNTSKKFMAIYFYVLKLLIDIL